MLIKHFTDAIRAHAKALALFAISLVFAIAALPALAQQQQQQQQPPPTAPNIPAVPYGYGHHMWGGGDGDGTPSRESARSTCCSPSSA